MIDQSHLFSILIGWTVFCPNENGFSPKNTSRHLKCLSFWFLSSQCQFWPILFIFGTFRVLLPIFSFTLLSNISLSYFDDLIQIYSPILISCSLFKAHSNYSTTWIIICSKSILNFPSIPLCPQRYFVRSLSKSTSANISHHWNVSAYG